MKLVHLIMKCPELDISLSNGELFMVGHESYREHLQNAPDRQEVSKNVVKYN